MKLPRFSKLNSKGFAHHLALILVVLGVAIGGTAYLVASHADTMSSLVFSAGSNIYTSSQTGPAVKVGSLYIDAGTSAAPLNATFANNSSNIYDLAGTTPTYHIYSIPPTGGTPTIVSTLTAPSGYRYASIAWSDTAQSFLLVALSQSIGQSKIYTLTLGSNSPRLIYTGVSYGEPVWAPRGNLFAIYEGYNPYIFTVNGKTSWPITVGCTNSTELTWTPDSKQIICDNDGIVNKVLAGQGDDLSTTLLAPTTTVPQGQGISAVSVSPDGTKIAWSVYPDTAAASQYCDIYVTVLGTSTKTKTGIVTSPNQTYTIDKLTGDECFQGSIDWSPNSQDIAFMFNNISSSKITATVYTSTYTGANLTAAYSASGTVTSAGESTPAVQGLDWRTQ